jgi:hypothetical protein
MKRIGLTIIGLVMGISLSHETAMAAPAASPPALVPSPGLAAQWWQWGLSIPTQQTAGRRTGVTAWSVNVVRYGSWPASLAAPE